jgi:hypothetical protein
MPNSRARCGSQRTQDTRPTPEIGQEQDEWPEEVAFYRKRTEALLRKYLRMSLQVGRVPSCLPRELLRARMSGRRGGSFEDCVIFVHDIEQCLVRLDRISMELLNRIAIQEYTQREAAELMGIGHQHLGRSYDDALDCLSSILLRRGLMEAPR